MWTDSSRKKLLALLFESGPIEPKHNHPATLTGEWSAEMASDAEHCFFSHFDMFADPINQLYTSGKGWEGGPWRLQELANTEIRASYNGPSFGRRYSVFYNQAAIGNIEISGVLYEAEKNPQVSTDVELEHIRLLPFQEIVGFLVTLAQYLAWGEPEQYANTQRAIDRALLAVVWNTKQNGDDDGTIELHLSGSAENYLKWRTLVLNNQARGA
jgi:hypothetical protein